MQAGVATKTVLYVENGIGFGGAVISLRTFLEHADRNRYSAVVLHSLDDARFETFHAFAKTVRLPRVSLGGGLAGEIGRKLNLDMFLYAHRIARIARTERADLLYLNNDLMANLAGMIAGRLSGLPVVLHERDIPPLKSRLATIAAPWATRCLALSAPVREALLATGVHAAKIRMVPEGLDFNFYRPAPRAAVEAARQSLGVRPSEKLVVLAGMVMGWKGQHVLISAAPAVLAASPAARFAIVGECPPGGDAYLRQLRDQAAGLGIADRVFFAGYRDDLPLLMQAADVVVHASTSPEPFGRVIIEGMVTGRPVVATAIGAPSEIIEHRQTGFLVPPGDAQALSAVLIELLTDADLRTRVGEKARLEVLQNYSIERHTSLIQGVFEEVFSGAPAIGPSGHARQVES